MADDEDDWMTLEEFVRQESRRLKAFLLWCRKLSQHTPSKFPLDDRRDPNEWVNILQDFAFDPDLPLTLPDSNCIRAYMHCTLCAEELKNGWKDGSLSGMSPKTYARTQTGWTQQGLQVWCNRHEVNVVHVHFEGMTHPANTTRPSAVASTQGGQGDRDGQ